MLIKNQEEFDFGLEEKRQRALAKLTSHPHYMWYASSGTVYIRKGKDKDNFNVMIRVFQAVEVEWFYIMVVDFDTAAFLAYDGPAELHWEIRENKELMNLFREWKI